MIKYLALMSVSFFITAATLQAKKSVTQGHSHGISHGSIWYIVIGFICMVAYVVKYVNSDPLLLFSYFGQLIPWMIIAYYRYFPKNEPYDNELCSNECFFKRNRGC